MYFSVLCCIMLASPRTRAGDRRLPCSKNCSPWTLSKTMWACECVSVFAWLNDIFPVPESCVIWSLPASKVLCGIPGLIANRVFLYSKTCLGVRPCFALRAGSRYRHLTGPKLVGSRDKKSASVDLFRLQFLLRMGRTLARKWAYWLIDSTKAQEVISAVQTCALYARRYLCNYSRDINLER